MEDERDHRDPHEDDEVKYSYVKRGVEGEGGGQREDRGHPHTTRERERKQSLSGNPLQYAEILHPPVEQGFKGVGVGGRVRRGGGGVEANQGSPF